MCQTPQRNCNDIHGRHGISSMTMLSNLCMWSSASLFICSFIVPVCAGQKETWSNIQQFEILKTESSGCVIYKRRYLVKEWNKVNQYAQEVVNIKTHFMILTMKHKCSLKVNWCGLYLFCNCSHTNCFSFSQHVCKQVYDNTGQCMTPCCTPRMISFLHISPLLLWNMTLHASVQFMFYEMSWFQLSCQYWHMKYLHTIYLYWTFSSKYIV